jgi:hypothetical protein
MNLEPKKVLQLIQVTSTFGKRAMDELSRVAAINKSAKDKNASMLQHLIDTKVIREDQREKAATALSDHSATLDLLKNAATKIAELNKATTPARELGNGEEKTAAVKEADYNSLNDPFVGVPYRNNGRKESDRVFAEKLGIDLN